MKENNNSYNASLKALLSHDVPEDLAEKVSEIVCKDNPEEENLGRTKDEQELVNKVLPYLNK